MLFFERRREFFFNKWGNEKVSDKFVSTCSWKVKRNVWEEKTHRKIVLARTPDSKLLKGFENALAQFVGKVGANKIDRRPKAFRQVSW